MEKTHKVCRQDEARAYVRDYEFEDHENGKATYKILHSFSNVYSALSIVKHCARGRDKSTLMMSVLCIYCG